MHQIHYRYPRYIQTATLTSGCSSTDAAAFRLTHLNHDVDWTDRLTAD